MTMSQIEGSVISITRKRPQRELPEEVLFLIFDSLAVEEMFLLSKVCNQWNQSFGNYLQKRFFDQKALGIRISMDQLPEDYRQCLNADAYDVKKRWNCADVCHGSGDGVYVKHLQNYSESGSPLSIILENCSQLQSLDLRGMTLNLNFLKTINKSCPDLECLHLNSVKIDSKAFYYLHKKIFPKLIHLSIDNLFEVRNGNNPNSFWNQLFQSAINLQDLKLDILPVQSQFDSSSLNQLSGALVYIHLNLYSKSDQRNPIKLIELIKNLSDGLGRDIQFLRLYSEEENCDNDCYLWRSELTRFYELKALNLSLKDKTHFEWFYETVKEVKTLESLTLNLNFTVDSQEILKLFLNSELKTHICRLKLENVVITEEFCDFLKTNYKELVSLQLIDVHFENIVAFIDFLTINESLSYLLFKLSKHSLKLGFAFPDHKFLDFVSKSNLKELDLINCQQIDQNKCQQICDKKEIEFFYKILPKLKIRLI